MKKDWPQSRACNYPRLLAGPGNCKMTKKKDNSETPDESFERIIKERSETEIKKERLERQALKNLGKGTIEEQRQRNKKAADAYYEDLNKQSSIAGLNLIYNQDGTIQNNQNKHHLSTSDVDFRIHNIIEQTKSNCLNDEDALQHLKVLTVKILSREIGCATGSISKCPSWKILRAELKQKGLKSVGRPLKRIHVDVDTMVIKNDDSEFGLDEHIS